jgi:UDP-N-acetylmuramoyl-tripeptide--D-alanyl-D-alanine ligase
MKLEPIKIILQYYLFVLAKIALWRGKPLVIAVAGSTNKTFTKLAIEALLREHGQNTMSESYNTEIGLPLAILGLKSGYNSYKRWLGIMFQALIRAFSLKLPKIIVLEFGSNKSGDLNYLAKIAKPKVAVITAITQRYLFLK